jgi:hypothetical protein
MESKQLPVTVINDDRCYGRETFMETRLHINDTVRLPGYPQLWKVVNTINGSKADIQRLHDDNPSIVTVTLEDLQVVRLFGSPNSLR